MRRFFEGGCAAIVDSGTSLLGEFRFLKILMLVHGRYSYNRNSTKLADIRSNEHSLDLSHMDHEPLVWMVIKAVGDEKTNCRGVSSTKQAVESSSSGDEPLSAFPCLVALNSGVRLALIVMTCVKYVYSPEIESLSKQELELVCSKDRLPASVACSGFDAKVVNKLALERMVY
ncbi:Regulator of chromosome condensation 1/beta-lactamase-inhibitor protein II [Artemisia annua]|uniref:Regulator of chromosome condensation 1/beta-lactamase-inhibitor protein II n=1 Tax=Artemisia annua TaxID=35608 RepID=A0A2U1L0Q8_ARTAN|nr:Regulator of chromosome condensation 1/beta-lactamase-inhibitor protein II [Artemisia annua]